MHLTQTPSTGSRLDEVHPAIRNVSVIASRIEPLDFGPAHTPTSSHEACSTRDDLRCPARSQFMNVPTARAVMFLICLMQDDFPSMPGVGVGPVYRSIRRQRTPLCSVSTSQVLHVQQLANTRPSQLWLHRHSRCSPPDRCGRYRNLMDGGTWIWTRLP